MSAEPSLYTVRDTCRACLSKIGEERYPLAPVSAASPNIGADEDGNRPDTLMPMTLVRCDACGHLQLSEIFDPGVVYAHYQYRTAISLGLVEHFRRTVDDLTGRFPMADASPLTVEMGSNDGSVLALYQEKGFRVLGVDPASDIVAEANRLGRPSIAGFFTRALSEEIRQEHGAASFIVANNVFANIDDLDDVVSGVAALLADDGVFIVETQDGAEMVAANLLDVVYHEHLSFFTAHSAERLYARLGLELIGVERHATKGGSLRLIAQKSGGHRPVDPSVAAIKADEQAKGVFEAGYLSAFQAAKRNGQSRVRRHSRRSKGQRRLGHRLRRVDRLPRHHSSVRVGADTGLGARRHAADSGSGRPRLCHPRPRDGGLAGGADQTRGRAGLAVCRRDPRQTWRPHTSGRPSRRSSAGPDHRPSRARGVMTASGARPLGIGMIGAGFVGQEAHLANYLKQADCRVVALAELRPDLGRDVAAKYGIPKVYDNHHALLEDDAVDAVIVVTRRHATGPIVGDALSAGKHVVSEKPMAHSTAKATMLADLADSQGCLYTVGFMKRHDPAVTTAKKYLDDCRQTGRLGRLSFVQGHCFPGAFFPPDHVGVMTAEPRPDGTELWPMGPDWMPAVAHTRFDRFLNVFIHDINLARHLADGPLTIRAATSTQDDSTFAIIGDVGGVPLSLAFSQQSQAPWREGMIFVFERGTVTVSVPAPMEKLHGGSVTIETEDGIEALNIPTGWGFERQAQAVVQDFTSGRPSIASGRDSIEDLQIAEDIWRIVLGKQGG